MKHKAGTTKSNPPNKSGYAKPAGKEVDTSGFVFEKENYRWLLIGIAFLVVGYLLMIGGRADHPDFFNYEVFSFRRITLAPILVIAGYMIGIYAIMMRPKKKEEKE